MLMQQAFGSGADQVSSARAGGNPLRESAVGSSVRVIGPLQFTVDELRAAEIGQEELPKGMRGRTVSRTELEAWCDLLAVEAVLLADLM